MKPYLKPVFILGLSLASAISACNGSKTSDKSNSAGTGQDSLQAYVKERLPIYEKVKLTTNLQTLTASERQMIPLLIDAAKIMDELFWKQAYPQRDSLLAVVNDEETRQFININYGPWDRLNGDKPFVAGIGPK